MDPKFFKCFLLRSTIWDTKQGFVHTFNYFYKLITQIRKKESAVGNMTILKLPALINLITQVSTCKPV